MRRLRVFLTPYTAYDENGTAVQIKSDVFAYPPNEDGSVTLEWESRQQLRVSKAVLEANTRLR